jgi:DNA polymerase I-like protein with 3'-5' exonuclease and polymerase domains
MLVFWTSADDDTFLQNVTRPLRLIREGVEHRKVKFDPEKPRYKARKGEIVVCMGDGPLKKMREAGVVPKKNKTVNSLRHKVIRNRYMFTFDPDAPKMDAAKVPLLQSDIAMADRFEQTGSLEPVVGKYKWVDDLTVVIEEILAEYKRRGKRVLVSNDLETMGLDPFAKGKKIVSTCFTVLDGTAYAVYMLNKTKEEKAFILDQINWIFNSKKVRLCGANFKFDLLWYRVKHALRCTNFEDDTLLMGSLLNENRSNSLKGHAWENTQLGGYETKLEDKYDKGEMEKIPLDDPDFLTYVGGDTDVCYKVTKKMRRDLKHWVDLQRFYRKVVHPASRAFESIEYQGVLIDRRRFAEVREIVQKEADSSYQIISDMIPRKMHLKYADKENLLTPAILREFLFTKAGLNLKPKMMTAKSGQPSTANDHLIMFHDNPDAKAFVDAYENLNSANKTISTFIDGFLKHVRSDGKFHPTYAMYNGDLFGSGKEKDDSGTVTGRFSTKAPSIHILPKHTKWAKLLRSCYPTVPGYTQFQIDFNEGELRIAACLSGDPTMIKVYKDKKSLHAMTGSTLVRTDIDTFMGWKTTQPEKYGQARQKSKAINFGFIFGLQAPGFREYARTSFGLELSEQESEEYRDIFFKTYDHLFGWHNTYTNMAKKNKMVVSPLGRIRHLPLVDSPFWPVKSKAERQAINSPVQGTLSDVCAYGISKIRERFTEEEVWVAGMTHDSAYGYIPSEHCTERLREMKFIMENLPLKKEFDWDAPVPFILDAEISTTNMAELKGISL